MAFFQVPNFRPARATGTQILNPGTGGPSGGAAGFPIIKLSRVPKTGPNGNAFSMNGAGGYISGFYGPHYAGPASPAQPGAMPYANQYAYAPQQLFINGLVKAPGAIS